MEMHCARNNCSLFALGSHQKKRPHNLVLGRLFDFRLYDMVEFGVAGYRSVQSFGGGAAQAQLGNKVGGWPRAAGACPASCAVLARGSTPSAQCNSWGSFVRLTDAMLCCPAVAHLQLRLSVRQDKCSIVP